MTFHDISAKICINLRQGNISEYLRYFVISNLKYEWTNRKKWVKNFEIACNIYYFENNCFVNISIFFVRLIPNYYWWCSQGSSGKWNERWSLCDSYILWSRLRRWEEASSLNGTTSNRLCANHLMISKCLKFHCYVQ